MITKNDQWNFIVNEMKTIHRLSKLTQAVMKKIEEIDNKNVKRKDK